MANSVSGAAESSKSQQDIQQSNGRTMSDSEAKDGLTIERINKECLLLENTTLDCAPHHLQLMLQAIDNKRLGQSELLFLLVYLAALESGFVEESVYEEFADQIVKTPLSGVFHSKNVALLARRIPTYESDEYKQSFSIKLCSNLDAYQIKQNALNVYLKAVVSGDLMIVSLVPQTGTEIDGTSICLSIARYVLSTPPKGKPLYQMFRKLDDLSHQLRSVLFVPLRYRQLSLVSWLMHPALNGLPEEIYGNIFRYLNKNQLNILANVNKKLNYIARQTLKRKFTRST